MSRISTMRIPAWNSVRRILTESMAQGGKQGVPFSHTSDRQSILIYREFCGFPAYALSRVGAYYNNYMGEAQRDNSPPLQMITTESLAHINVPTMAVLSKYEVMVIEALALGVVVCDDEHYYMVTRDEWKRRQLAEETQAKGGFASPEDRTAGSQRRMGVTLREVISQLGEKLPDEARLTSQQVLYEDAMRQEIQERKLGLAPDLLCDMVEALYFEGFMGTQREQINLATEIRPQVVFILKRDFGLEERHIHRPQVLHKELLRGIFLTPTEVR